MVADQRYDQIDAGARWLRRRRLSRCRRAVDLPFRAWNWVSRLVRRPRPAARTRTSSSRPGCDWRTCSCSASRRSRTRTAGCATCARTRPDVAERVLVASILNVDLDPFRHRVLLDKGALDGVFKGQAVLDGEGIFGQVSRTSTPRTSEVDPDQRCRARDPGAVEPQRRAHDRGRHRRLEQAVAAVRHRRSPT